MDLLDKLNNPDNHQPYSEADDDDLEVRARLPKSRSGPVEAADVCVLHAPSDKLKPAPC